MLGPSHIFYEKIVELLQEPRSMKTYVANIV